MHSAAFKNLARLQKSLSITASGEEIFEVSTLADVWASGDFLVSVSKCSNRILKVAKDLSKFATVYYGKGGAGLLLVCKEDGTVLLLKRSKSVEQPFTWGIPGGALSKGEGWYRGEDIKNDDGPSNEDFSETAFREAGEELFSDSSIGLNKSKMNLIGQTDFKDEDGGFTYRTFVYDIPLDEKNRISANLSLNWENDRAKWYRLSDLPLNLHFGIKFTKDNLEEQGIQLFESKEDELDWIREYLKGLAGKVDRESHQVIKDLIGKVSVMIPTKLEEGEDHSDFRFRRTHAVHDFFNYAVKEISRAGERKTAIEMMNYASRFAQKPKDKYRFTDEKSLLKMPRSEQSAHAGFFYHGSELRNAISILKSNTFVGAGAFTRLSLTADLSVAAKFGDTIFVFDAKKLQRSGAKKMNYGDIPKIERAREQSGKPIDENYLKNPWISELYQYEKEWVLPLPYQIKSGDLVKIIFFSNTRDKKDDGRGGGASANEAFAALDEATDIPIEIMNYPSFGSHSPPSSKKMEPESANLTELVYTSALSEQASSENLMKKYLNERTKEFPFTDSTGDRTKDPVYGMAWALNRAIENMGSYARQLDFKSNYDAGRIFEFYSEIKRMGERIGYLADNYRWEILISYGLSYRDEDRAKALYEPYVRAMKEICEKIVSKEDDFKNIILKKNFGDTDNPKEENYIVRYFVYPSGESEVIRGAARDFCSKNIDKILAIQNLREYLDANGPKVYGESNYKWYSKDISDYSLSSRIEDAMRYADPTKIPDDAYVEHFLSLIDSEKLDTIPDDRLERLGKRYLAEGREKYAGGGKYDDQWIYNYRGYRSPEFKRKLEILMRAMNKNSQGFATEDSES